MKSSANEELVNKNETICKYTNSKLHKTVCEQWQIYAFLNLKVFRLKCHFQPLFKNYDKTSLWQCITQVASTWAPPLNHTLFI